MISLVCRIMCEAVRYLGSQQVSNKSIKHKIVSDGTTEKCGSVSEDQAKYINFMLNVIHRVPLIYDSDNTLPWKSSKK